MKHQKEWRTCDRCGAEINENERSMFLKKVYRISRLLVRKYAYEKVRQEIAHLFDKYLDFTIKGKETATKLKAKAKFEKFIKGDSDDAI